MTSRIVPSMVSTPLPQRSRTPTDTRGDNPASGENAARSAKVPRAAAVLAIVDGI